MSCRVASLELVLWRVTRMRKCLLAYIRQSFWLAVSYTASCCPCCGKLFPECDTAALWGCFSRAVSLRPPRADAL